MSEEKNTALDSETTNEENTVNNPISAGVDKAFESMDKIVNDNLEVKDQKEETIEPEKSTEEIVVNNPETIETKKEELDELGNQPETIELKLSDFFVVGENTLKEEHFDALPNLSVEGYNVDDILIFNADETYTKKIIEPIKPLDASDAKLLRIKEIITSENNFSNLSVGKHLKGDYSDKDLKTFFEEYKLMGALSTPEHYELVSLLGELFPIEVTK